MSKIKIFILVVLFGANFSIAQNSDEEAQKIAEQALRDSKNITYDANKELVQNDFINAEAEYRKAISKSSENIAAPYNLGRAYYNRESFEEAFGRFKSAGEKATEKPDKHKAFHNMGNVFMKNKEYAKAVEAYKEALRANPNDDETRYNLALAKKMQEQDKNDQNNDNNQDKNDQNKDDQNQNQDQNQNEGDNEQKDEGDEKDKEGENGDEGNEKSEENKEGDGDQKKEQEQKPKNEGDEKDDRKNPRPNQLSKQQIQNLLEAMQNEEKKVQEKLNAQKVRGAKTKNEKDW
ncbi:hypothetical protein GCM10011414_04120 [Croceivirga lutea]|nr:hypothetical protein GCM10011414_04120 [Croceivirga lutea]